jgi:hypothetical protein
MVIDLPICCWSSWKIVRASIVDIAPHLTMATFAVHRSIKNSDYVVSVIETGELVATGNTRNIAEINARFRCKDKTNRHLAAAFRKWKKLECDKVNA